MKFTVKALPIKEVISDIALEFKVPLQKDEKEYTLHLPEHIGEGFIRGTNFKSGIGIIQYKCTFFKDTEIHFTSERKHPLKFIFCTEGRVEHSFQYDEERHNIETYQNIIVSSSGKNGHVLYFKANQVANVASLEIIRHQFSQYIDYGFSNLDSTLKEILGDSESEKQFIYHGNYSIKSADIVDDMQKKERSGFLRAVFLESKTFEMLFRQIDQYQDDQDNDRLPQVLRRTDVEKVKHATGLIEQDLSQNYSVDQLAKEVGTNANKLQEGFKYMFDLTVNKYMQQVKLEAARKLLTSSDHNVSQIVLMIGLNNRSYFSKIFKDRYGVSPKYFLQKKNQEESEQDSGYDKEEDKIVK